MTSVDPEYTAYLEQIFAYEEEGFKAAEQGNYDKAIENWNYILGDQDKASCFSEEAQQEMAFNLAAAYYLNGDDESFEKTAADWRLTDDDKVKIRESVEAG
jgi:hypothetical protein